MALTKEHEGQIKAGISAMSDAEVIRKTKQRASDLKDVANPAATEVIFYELQSLAEEINRRGLLNPLASQDPVAPPPIPGVVMPPPAQAPKPPQPPAPAQYPPPNQQFSQSYRLPTVVPPVANTPNSNPVNRQQSTIPQDKRTCNMCPAFIATNQTARQIETFGKNMGLPMCGRFKIPLSTLNSDDDQTKKIMSNFAKGCSKFGHSPDQYPDGDKDKILQIARPNGGLVEKIELNLDAATAKSCTSCTFYSDPSTMITSLGIPQAGCAVTGKLIPIGKAKETAQACTLSFQDFNHTAAKDAQWDLLNGYRGNVTVVTAGERVNDSKELHPDPTTYLTDKPVSAEDSALGIRAWQKLMDPEKGSNRFIYMPIFDRGSFSEEDRAKIPTAGRTPEDDHPELYEDHFGMLYTCVVLWLQLHETPALNGIAGTGKTEFFRYAAWRMQLPFERFSITNSTELDELQGRMNLVATETGNKTEFVYGRVSLAWGKRCVLCVDEPNTGPNDVWQFFRPLTDNSKQLVLDVNNGERLERNKYCLMGMAFNPAWDMRNVGTHEIGDADGSRLMHISVPMPSEAQERNIIKRRCELDGYKIPKDHLDAVMNIAKELRELASQDAFPVHWGIRNQIKVARALAWFPMKRAYRLAAGDLLEPQYCDQLLVMVDSHTPKEGGATPTKRGPGRPRKNP